MKKVIIVALSLLFLFQGIDVNAKCSLVADDVCAKSSVTFDTSSLKNIFLHAEEILNNPEEFWEKDPAYKVIKKILTSLKRPIPYAKWKENISTIVKLSKEERQKNPYYLIARDLEEKADYFNSTAMPYVCSYFPEANKPDISFIFYVTAYTGAYRTMYQNTLLIDVAHSRWGGHSKNILNNLVRVLFDVGYRKMLQSRAKEPLDKNIFRQLRNLYIRGMCTYVAYKAIHLFPVTDIQEFAMLENPSDVARLREQLNSLFSKAKTMSEKDLRMSASKIGIRDKAYYVVGAFMAKTIEEKRGRKGLVDTLTKSPLSFVQTYNSLVSNDEKIYEFDIKKN